MSVLHERLRALEALIRDLRTDVDAARALADAATTSDTTQDAHIADSTLHFTEGSIDHGSIAGKSDDDHPQYVLVDGSRAMTGGLTVNSTDGLTVVGAAPQLKISDSSTDEATKKGFITLAHDDSGSEEDFCIVYARSQDLVGKLSFGGGHSSVNAASAVSIYCAADGDTVTGTEIFRAKLGGVRVLGSGNPDAGACLDLQGTSAGFLPPRVTTSQRNAIASGSPTAGMTVYNSTTSKLEVWNGSSWNQCW